MDKYKKDNYYEYFSLGKDSIKLRFLKNYNGRYLVYDIHGEKELSINNSENFNELTISVLDNVESKLINNKYKSIFSDFLCKYGLNLIASTDGYYLILKNENIEILKDIEIYENLDDENKKNNKDFLNKISEKIKENIIIKDSINAFFQKLKSLEVNLTEKEKDNFIKGQIK